MNVEDIDHLFSYHPPKGDQAARYEQIRAAARQFARLVNDLVPDGHEKAVAFDRLRESVMWANAGIACARFDVGGVLPPGRTEKPYAGGAYGDDVLPC